MAYGDLPFDAPLKPNKGVEGGACNRQRCQAEPALFYNHGAQRWYCADCARAIANDTVNARDWPKDFQSMFPEAQIHPMFETREQMMTRQTAVSSSNKEEDPTKIAPENSLPRQQRRALLRAGFTRGPIL